MKKFLYSILIVLALLIPASAFAESGVTVIVDGVKLNTDQPAEIINGRTMVPLRSIFESLGALVYWDGDTQQILSRKDDIYTLMQIGSDEMIIQEEENAETYHLDSAPVIKGGRTLVPVRAVAEAMNCDVKWEQETKTVYIDSNIVLHGGGDHVFDDVEGVISNGVAYYSMLNDNNIYMYDGNEIKTLSAGGQSMDLQIHGDNLYYFNKTNAAIYRMNVKTGTKEPLHKAMFKYIHEYYIYGNRLVIKGIISNDDEYDEYNDDSLYIYTIGNKEPDEIIDFRKIIPKDNIPNPTISTEIGTDGIIYITADDLEDSSQGTKYLCAYYIYDIKTNSLKEVFQALTSEINVSGGFGWHINSVFYDGNIYSHLAIKASSTKVLIEEHCFKYNVENETTTDCSKTEYDQAVKSAQAEEPNEPKYYYSDYNLIKEADGFKEVLYNNEYTGRYLYSFPANSGMILFGTVNTKYTNARMYIVNTDGSNLKELSYAEKGKATVHGDAIPSLSSTPTQSSTGGATIETTKPCGLCGGSGQMKCNMCGGDGMMPSLVTFGVGGRFEESCRYCSGGTKRCTACGGDGVIQ